MGSGGSHGRMAARRMTAPGAAVAAAASSGGAATAHSSGSRGGAAGQVMCASGLITRMTCELKCCVTRAASLICSSNLNALIRS